jgi:hypothetical protein
MAKRQKTSNTPSDEEFERVHARMRAEESLYAGVRAKVLSSFPKVPLRDIFGFGDPAKRPDVWVFYETSRDIEVYRANGAERSIKEAIRRELVSVTSKVVPVQITFDSHENVQRKCNGNYWKYLK